MFSFDKKVASFRDITNGLYESISESIVDTFGNWAYIKRAFELIVDMDEEESDDGQVYADITLEPLRAEVKIPYKKLYRDFRSFVDISYEDFMNWIEVLRSCYKCHDDVIYYLSDEMLSTPMYGRGPGDFFFDGIDFFDHIASELGFRRAFPRRVKFNLYVNYFEFPPRHILIEFNGSVSAEDVEFSR